MRRAVDAQCRVLDVGGRKRGGGRDFTMPDFKVGWRGRAELAVALDVLITDESRARQGDRFHGIIHLIGLRPAIEHLREADLVIGAIEIRTVEPALDRAGREELAIIQIRNGLPDDLQRRVLRVLSAPWHLVAAAPLDDGRMVAQKPDHLAHGRIQVFQKLRMGLGRVSGERHLHREHDAIAVGHLIKLLIEDDATAPQAEGIHAGLAGKAEQAAVAVVIRAVRAAEKHISRRDVGTVNQDRTAVENHAEVDRKSFRSALAKFPADFAHAE